MPRDLDMRLRHRPQRALALVLAVLVLAGCASTRRAGSDTAGPVSGDPSVGAPVDGGTGASPGVGAPGGGASAKPGASRGPGGGNLPTASTGGPGTSSGSVGPGGSASTGGSGTTTGVPVQPGGGPVRLGPGVSAKQINIGITLFKGGQVFAAAVGGNTSGDTGDTQKQADAVVAYVNAHGGIGGRRVNPIYYTFDLTRPGLTDGQSEQEACAKWTEDNKVAAVVNYALGRLDLLACLAKRGVPGLHQQMPIDEQTLAKYRDYYYSGSSGPGLTLERQAALQVEVFGQKGYWRGAVVGLEYFDDPAYKRVVDQVFVPGLKKYGVKKIVLQGAPRGGTDQSSYVARFKREGVTHVMFMGEAASYPIFFMQTAENQLYRPKYGLNSDQTPSVLFQQAAPAAQMANAIGVGWQPVTDVDNAHDPGPVSASNSLCLDIQRKAGQDMSNRYAAYTALLYCSGLFFLQQTLGRTNDTTAAGLAKVVNALGGHFSSPLVYSTFFSAARHDGVNAYRDFAFDKADKAWHYTSGVKRMPV